MSSKSSKGPNPAKREPVTIELLYPIEIAGEITEKLVVQPARAKHMRQFPASNPSVGDLMNVAALMCGKADLVIDELDAQDWGRLQEVVGDFLAPFLDAGDDSAEP